MPAMGRPSCGSTLRSNPHSRAPAECGSAGELQDVALRMAATDAVGHRRQAAQQAVGYGEVLAAEGGERTARRQADEPCHLVIGDAGGTLEAALLRREQPLDAVP